MKKCIIWEVLDFQPLGLWAPRWGTPDRFYTHFHDNIRTDPLSLSKSLKNACRRLHFKDEKASPSIEVIVVFTVTSILSLHPLFLLLYVSPSLSILSYPSYMYTPFGYFLNHVMQCINLFFFFVLFSQHISFICSVCIMLLLSYCISLFVNWPFQHRC